MYILPDDGAWTVKTCWRSGGDLPAYNTRMKELRRAVLVTSTKPQVFILSNNYKVLLCHNKQNCNISRVIIESVGDRVTYESATVCLGQYY